MAERSQRRGNRVLHRHCDQRRERGAVVRESDVNRERSNPRPDIGDSTMNTDRKKFSFAEMLSPRADAFPRQPVEKPRQPSTGAAPLNTREKIAAAWRPF